MMPHALQLSISCDAASQLTPSTGISEAATQLPTLSPAVSVASPPSTTPTTDLHSITSLPHTMYFCTALGLLPLKVSPVTLTLT
jgi:hypothetical protein